MITPNWMRYVDKGGIRPRPGRPIGDDGSIAHHSASLPPSIATYTGPLFNYEDPHITLADVARGLSNVCRFGGQVDRYYTVAEHSCLVAAMVYIVDPELALAALWHDAHEAYIGDVPTPLKGLLGPNYTAVRDRIDDAVRGYLGSDPDLHHPTIKWADRLAMLYEASILQPRSDAWAFTRELPHTEARQVWTDECLGVSPLRAERMFLIFHERLCQPC
jgi:hypothetical protein